MNFNLTLTCNGASFGEDPHDEIARLLVMAAVQVKDGRNEGRLRDSNGNTVGRFALTEED